jgi:hypothetical protein
MQLWGASTVIEPAVEISATGKIHWTWNACPQECHRSLSRGASSVDTPLQETRNVYTGRDNRRYVALEKGHLHLENNILPGYAVKGLTEPMESQMRSGTQWYIQPWENLDQAQRENFNHGQSSKRDIKGPGPYRFKTTILKENCSEHRQMKLSMVLSHRRLDKCQVLCSSQKDG